MFIRLLGWLRNRASAVVAEAYGGEVYVQGGALLRITNQRGLSQLLGVEPGARPSLPEGGCGQKVISLYRNQRIGSGDVTTAPLHVGTPHDGLSLLHLGRPEPGSPSCRQLWKTLKRWRQQHPTPDQTDQPASNISNYAKSLFSKPSCYRLLSTMV